jgi:hydroxyethylthiazole kinase-like uncharacterized protein yjeF
MHILSTEQVRTVENMAFKNGLPVAALMEKAGLALFTRFCALFPFNTHNRVGVFAGPGHNGADALILARELLLQGRDVVVWSDFPYRKDLCQQHLSWFQALGGATTTSLNSLSHCDVFVDGLLGFGTTKAPTGGVAHAIDWLCAQKKPVVAVDIPSGMCSDTGTCWGSTTKATHTLMLSPARIGLFQPAALESVGALETIEIGIPNSFVESVLQHEFPGSTRVHVLNPQALLAKHSAMRKPNDNKYTTGRVLIVAGSQKYPGAAILAAMGCRSVGPGYIVMDTSLEAQAALLTIAPDIVFRANEPLNTLAAQPSAHSFDAILCGSGLGNQPEKLKACFAASAKTLVLDADALTILAQQNAFPVFASNVVITPHEAEFARLFPSLCSVLPRSEAAAAAAKQLGAIVVLKGPRTVIAHPSGEVFINTQSTPALARAGTGDVLAGMIAAFAAHRMSAFEAAQCAVWLHSQRALQIDAELSTAQCDALRLATHTSCVD